MLGGGRERCVQGMLVVGGGGDTMHAGLQLVLKGEGVEGSVFLCRVFPL